MPNRILKESICTSSNLDNLSPEEEVFFYRLIVNCDDYGRFDARPAILRARLFPLRLDRVKETHIIKWLETLVEQDLLELYEVEGQRYLQFKTWENHQQIRAKRSKYPDSNGHLLSGESMRNQVISSASNSPRNPIQSESNPNPNTIHQFDIFWKEYPRKVDKAKALKAFEKLKPDEELLGVMLQAIIAAKASDVWRETRFIPHPTTWLNGKRWEDELPKGGQGGTNRGHIKTPTTEDLKASIGRRLDTDEETQSLRDSIGKPLD
jgi:hypothetical protein